MTEKSPAKAQPAAARTQSTVPAGEAVPVIKGSKVYLIDGSGFIFRAFFQAQSMDRKYLFRSDGTPTGAVHLFCSMLWKLLRETKAAEAPTHIAVIFDAGRETFRNEIYVDYKAHRPPPPDELIPQFALIREAVAAFNVACVEQDGFEADDLIATYSRSAVKSGAEVIIVSSDKDLMQLIEPGVSMLDGMKGKRIGREEVIEKFGVAPELVTDVQALAGDSIDNVPGVPGIGIKTAAELITAFGDLESLLERAGEIKQPKRRERLIEFAEQARLSRKLVELRADVPVQVPLDGLGVQDPDPATLLGYLREMEFTTLTKRIAEALGQEAPPPRLTQATAKAAADPSAGTTAPSASGPRSTPAAGAAAGAGTPAAGAKLVEAAVRTPAVNRTGYEIIGSAGKLHEWVARAVNAGRVALTVESDDTDTLRGGLAGIGLAVAPGQACYLPLQHRQGASDLFAGSGLAPGQIPLREALDVLAPLLADAGAVKIGHDIKSDLYALGQYGLTFSSIDDVMLMSYALDGGRGSQALADLSERHVNHVTAARASVLEHAPGTKKSDRRFSGVPVPKAAEYAAEAADIILRVYLALKTRLPAETMTTVYETLERPLVPVICDMERAGIKVDRQILARLSGTFAQRAAAAEEEIYRLAGQKFNLGSPKQLGEFLFDTLKLPGGKKTKTGQWETRAGLLDDLASNEELPEDARSLVNSMLEWRQLTKLKSTYSDALPEYIVPETQRIHTRYALASTTTGRLSSNDPNLQNIPIRTKEGREIRTAFIADKGMKLVSADYSQIELRVLAHVADIPQLKKAFASGLDIHAMTASEMFGVPVKDMPGEVRRRAKAINFGIIYGISAFGLANQLGISREEAGDYIRTYFQRFPGIRDYMDATKKAAHANGFVETIFGRRIHYPEINTRNPSVRSFLERAAINAPIQGSAADIIRRAMVRIPPALAAAKLDAARMLLQVHDELVFEVKDADATKLMSVARHVMETAAEPAVKLTVPIHVDAKAASNWDEAH